MRRVPVRWRLTIGFTVVTAIILAITGVFVHDRLAANLDSAIAATLRARVADVTALATQSESGLREAAQPPTGHRGVEFAQLVNPAGTVIDHTPGLPPQPLLSAAQLRHVRTAAGVTTDIVLNNDEPVRLSAVAIRAQDQRLVVIVGQSLEARNRALGDLAAVLLAGGLGALLLTTVAGYGLTGAALRPVEAMRRRAQTISATTVDGRLPSAGRDDELGRLGRTLNDMLDRVQHAVERERTFVSDASHELRSPLATLRTELELLARDHPTGARLEQAVGSAIDETDRLTQLTDDLLTLARADDGQVVVRRAHTSTHPTLTAAAGRARRRHPLGRVAISVRATPDTPLFADAARVGQALDNMIDNAMRYASTSVELVANCTDLAVELHVRDDGPGFPAEFLDHAWERFARADRAHTDNGTGLGLAIVRTTAEIHDGQAQATNLDGGGADVWIALPR
jgi:signal transduction histidine kinase